MEIIIVTNRSIIAYEWDDPQEEGRMGEVNKKITSGSKKKKSKQTYYMQF
jgi:hypothetical protein